jgi:lysophospholipase L1-like esterase
MKTVLCYGDSNTWGFIAGTEAERYPWDIRWPGVCQAALGDAYRIIEEGQNGRTTAWDDPLDPDRNGKTYFPVALQTHAPMDLVLILLGTNDLKHYFHHEAIDIAMGAGKLVSMAQESGAGVNKKPPKVLLVSPAEVVDSPNPFGHKFVRAVERSRKLALHYKEIADEMGCEFFSAASVVNCPDTDGIHIDDAGHKQLGEALADKIREII